MGDHYVPQRYLENFTEPSGTLYGYEKATLRKFMAHPKTVVNEREYYSRDIETYLATKIEGPANGVLTKITNRQALTDRDKLAFSRYMVVMIKRVPKGKEILRSSLPVAAQYYREKLEQDFTQIAKLKPEKLATIQARKQHIAELLDSYAENMTREIWLDTLPPEVTPKIVNVFYNMEWRFFIDKQSPSFLTNDNPVFFDLKRGLGNINIDVTFPISKHIALWATWPQGPARYIDQGYLPATNKLIRLINKRTVVNATRFIFSAGDFEWIPRFIERHRTLLNE